MINIFELNRARDEKEIRRIENYRVILEKIHLKIIDHSNRGITQCFYVVPPFLVGLPSFNQQKCIDYILDRLYKNGFAVMYIKPNIIYCSWEHIPSTVKKPELKAFEEEIIDNPYKDYSKLVAQVSGKEAKMPRETYKNYVNNTDTYTDGDAEIKNGLTYNQQSSTISHGNNNQSQIGYLGYFVNNEDSLRVTNNVSRLQYNPNKF